MCKNKCCKKIKLYSKIIFKIGIFLLSNYGHKIYGCKSGEINKFYKYILILLKICYTKQVKE